MVNKFWLSLPSSASQKLFHLYLQSKSLGSPKNKTPNWNSFSFKGLNFENPLGIAGGLDKNADYLKAWQSLGCGFVEVGTLTPRQEKPNPGKILDRDNLSQSLWNHMGFPNKGCEYALNNISKYRKKANSSKPPLFINIGKSKSTSNDKALEDYSLALKKVEQAGDAFVVNISSPNSPNLRQLFEESYLKDFLSTIRGLTGKPLILKISPDLEQSDLERVLKIAVDQKWDGFNLTNTTTTRFPNNPFPTDKGGVSGKPLAELSKQKLKSALEILDGQKDLLIISTGGIMSYEDIQERLELGANLVQVYAALVFLGPLFFKDCAQKAKSSF